MADADGSNSRIIGSFLAAVFFLLLIIPAQVSAVDTDYSDDAITIVTGDNYPPFSFRDSNGDLQGISIDQWKLWEEKTGIEAEITGMSWADAQAAFEAGEYDVLETPMYTPERAEKYEFSKPYAEIESAIYFNSEISGISGPESLKGFVVAVLSGDASYDYLVEKGVTDFAEYDSYEDIILAANEGNVVVFVMDSPQADYYLYKSGLQDQFRRTEPMYTSKVHRAVLKENSALIDVIDSGFDSISEDEYKSIDTKWYGISEMQERDLTPLFIFIGAILLCMLLLAGWNHILKLRVRDKTSELLREIDSGKEITAKLFESEQRFRKIFDNINDAVFLISAESPYEKGAIISVNRAAWEMLGYSEDELMSLSPPEIHSEKGKADLDTASEIIKKDGDAILETEYMRKDGSVFPVEISLHFFILGERKVVLAVARDISERVTALKRLEASERRYRNVVEDQTELICRFNNDFTIKFANGAFCSYFGLEKESVAGKKISSFIFPQDMEWLKEHIKILTPENPIEYMEHRIILPDGRVRWQAWSNRAIFDENENFIEFQSVGRDITETRQKDEALALAAKKLNILNNVTLSEIQNYLFCEQGYLQLTTDLSENEKQKEFLGKQAFNLDKITRILQFAKNYQGLGISPPEWHDFEKTFIFAISHTNTAHLEKDFDVSGISIFTDNLLEKALAEMVSKLLSYNKEATRLSLKSETEGEMLKIIFETDGRGIPKESEGKIFSRGGDPDTGIDLFLIEEVLSVTNISVKETGDPGKGIRIEIIVPPGMFRTGEGSFAD